MSEIVCFSVLNSQLYVAQMNLFNLIFEMVRARGSGFALAACCTNWYNTICIKNELYEFVPYNLYMYEFVLYNYVIRIGMYVIEKKICILLGFQPGTNIRA